MNFKHVSVLLDECIDSLNIKEDGIYVDGTMGGAGHSLKICEHLSDKGRLIGIDQDKNAHLKAKEVLKEHLHKVTFVHDNFSNIDNILKELNIEKIDGMLLDLGVSSHQLDEKERGFSYMQDALLDMRMDIRQEKDAGYIVNNYSEDELNDIIHNYGEERWAKRIAKFIVAERNEKEIKTTQDLVTVIKKAIPKSARADGPHPAKRTFQAIRIEVNNELGILKNTINDVVKNLSTGGRLSIITFHSLEDRIVKNEYKHLFSTCICPRELPICMCDKKREVEIITRKPIIPSKEELEYNHRARSAKLRVCEKK